MWWSSRTFGRNPGAIAEIIARLWAVQLRHIQRISVSYTHPGRRDMGRRGWGGEGWTWGREHVSKQENVYQQICSFVEDEHDFLDPHLLLRCCKPSPLNSLWTQQEPWVFAQRPPRLAAITKFQSLRFYLQTDEKTPTTDRKRACYLHSNITCSIQ